jgi:adenosine deaminase
MKRNRGGERDLDHIIMAATRGLDRASLEYPIVRAGLILMMDRTFDERQNAIIVEKAIRYAPRGVVGVDIAGPRPGGERYPYRDLSPLVEEARSAGLGVTIHVGEEGEEHGDAEIGEVVEHLRPDRIGHGILAARNPELMAALREQEIVLEICPTSNLLTRALPSEEAVRDTFRAFVENGVAFTIATDGPEMMRTHLRDEFELLQRIGALDEDELAEANRRGHEASFVRAAPPLACSAAGVTPAGVRPKLRRPVNSRRARAVVSVAAMVTVLHEGPPVITDRQLQVIELIAAGYSNDEVARRLGISRERRRPTRTCSGRSWVARGVARSRARTARSPAAIPSHKASEQDHPLRGTDGTRACGYGRRRGALATSGRSELRFEGTSAGRARSRWSNSRNKPRGQAATSSSGPV